MLLGEAFSITDNTMSQRDGFQKALFSYFLNYVSGETVTMF